MNGKSIARGHSPLGLVLMGGMAIAALIVIVRSAPDLARYLRVRRM
jgi:hypothetical protein